MPFVDEQLYDPNRIIINRDERQRRDLDLNEGFLNSIKKNGVIEPIIVHRDTWELVAGERRTLAARQVSIQVPIRFFDTLSKSDLRRIELEENVKREDLYWKDNVTAYAELHKIYTEEHKARGEEWSVEKSAAELSISVPHLHRILRVYANLNSPRLAHVTSYDQAYGVLLRFAERKTSAIVAEITAAGARLFSISPPQVTSDAHPSNGTTLQQGPSNNPTQISGTGIAQPTILPIISGMGASSDTNAANGAFQPPPPTITPPPAPAFDPAIPIVSANFLTWAPTYSGPPFTFVHCDFPYGVNTADSLIESYENNGKIYWDLLDCLCANASRLFSYSSHLMFWLSMRDDFFQPTKQRLRACGFHVIDRPLIWLKSDGRGAAPGIRGTQPRHIYEAALLASRGQRPLVKQAGDAYAAPSVSNPIHPTQKPEPMLKYFFSMLVDETTTFFDPTAGSGASLRAAEEMGAKSVNGLELEPGYAAAANSATLRARAMRKIAG